MKYITFTCSRFGKPNSKSRYAFKFRPVTKSDCKAKLNANFLSDGKWVVSTIVLGHNHDLSTPSKRRYYKTERDLPSRVKKRLATNDIARVIHRFSSARHGYSLQLCLILIFSQGSLHVHTQSICICFPFFD